MEGKRKGGSGCLTSWEVQQSHRPHGAVALSGCPASIQLPLSSAYILSIRCSDSTLGKKRDDQRGKKKQPLHLDAAGSPSHPEGKKLFMPPPAATSVWSCDGWEGQSLRPALMQGSGGYLFLCFINGKNPEVMRNKTQRGYIWLSKACTCKLCNACFMTGCLELNMSPQPCMQGMTKTLVSSLACSIGQTWFSIQITKETVNLAFDILLSVCYR